MIKLKSITSNDQLPRLYLYTYCSFSILLFDLIDVMQKDIFQAQSIRGLSGVKYICSHLSPSAPWNFYTSKTCTIALTHYWLVTAHSFCLQWAHPQVFGDLCFSYLLFYSSCVSNSDDGDQGRWFLIIIWFKATFAPLFVFSILFHFKRVLVPCIVTKNLQFSFPNLRGKWILCKDYHSNNRFRRWICSIPSISKPSYTLHKRSQRLALNYSSF